MIKIGKDMFWKKDIHMKEIRAKLSLILENIQMLNEIIENSLGFLLDYINTS